MKALLISQKGERVFKHIEDRHKGGVYQAARTSSLSTKWPPDLSTPVATVITFHYVMEIRDAGINYHIFEERP